MAYVYSGDNYRGGAAGVQADLDLRQYFAQQAAQALSQGYNLPTQDQIAAGKQDLQPAQAAYQYLAANGMYSPGEMGALESAAVQNVNAATRAMQQNLNATAASRGQSANGGQAAALAMSGQFAGAGQRGQVRADVLQKNKESQLAGLEGYTDLSKSMAGLDTTATRQDANVDQYMDVYNQFRNSQVGYDGAKWKMSEPDQPDYYDEEADAGTKKKGLGNYSYGAYTTGGL